jgi:hypothetical protein
MRSTTASSEPSVIGCSVWTVRVVLRRWISPRSTNRRSTTNTSSKIGMIVVAPSWRMPGQASAEKEIQKDRQYDQANDNPCPIETTRAHGIIDADLFGALIIRHDFYSGWPK